MKKMMMMVMAAMAIGFTACGNKAQQAPADEVAVTADSTAAAIDVEGIVGEVTAQLAEEIQAKDAGKLQQTIEAVQAKVLEMVKTNPEAAKAYVEKVQNYLKENAEQVKAIVGDNAVVKAAVSALTDAPADAIVSSLASTIDGAQAVGDAAVDAAKQAGQDAVDAAKQAGQDAVDAAKQKANEQVEAAKEKANAEIDKAANETADKAKKALGL